MQHSEKKLNIEYADTTLPYLPPYATREDTTRQLIISHRFFK
jgi:hypothetical protein